MRRRRRGNWLRATCAPRPDHGHRLMRSVMGMKVFCCSPTAPLAALLTAVALIVLALTAAPSALGAVRDCSGNRPLGQTGAWYGDLSVRNLSCHRAQRALRGAWLSRGGVRVQGLVVLPDRHVRRRRDLSVRARVEGHALLSGRLISQQTRRMGRSFGAEAHALARLPPHPLSQWTRSNRDLARLARRSLVRGSTRTSGRGSRVLRFGCALRESPGASKARCACAPEAGRHARGRRWRRGSDFDGPISTRCGRLAAGRRRRRTGRRWSSGSGPAARCQRARRRRC